MKKNNDNQIANLEMNKANMGASLKNLETQVRQLAHSMKKSFSRSFLSGTEKNLKDCMVITLRSGKELVDVKELGNSKKVENEKIVNEEVDNKKVENEKVETKKQDVQMDKKDEKREENKSTPGKVLFSDKPSPTRPHFPFPQRFRKTKLDG